MILAATGHRPPKLGGYSSAAEERLNAFALLQLEARKPEQIVTGMAQGWDQAIAQAARALKIPYIAAVPFAGQEAPWPLAAQEKYRTLLQNASEVHVISPGGYEAWKLQKRNEWMVRRCNLLLALWDGSKGGTGNCMRYALDRIDKGIDIIIENTWSEWCRSRT